jgi:hypothetical protein
VSDAGSPVKGAKVTAGGDSATTNAVGRAKLELTAKHALKTTASDAGYVGATISLKVVN